MIFNHFDDQGQAVMVNITTKPATLRCAVAAATVFLGEAVFAAVMDGQVAKGDVLGVARLAGIAAAKKTPDLIPLSHPLALHHVAIDFVADDSRCAVQVQARVEAFERTGVEMEAMVAAGTAALTIYDMCKGADKSIRITDIELLFKDGGKSGVYQKGGVL